MYIKTVHNRNSNVNYLFFKKYNFEARPYHRIETALVTFGLNRLKRQILSGSRYFQIDSERQTVTKEDGCLFARLVCIFSPFSAVCIFSGEYFMYVKFLFISSPSPSHPPPS